MSETPEYVPGPIIKTSLGMPIPSADVTAEHERMMKEEP